MSIPIDTEVFCGSIEETRRAILIFKAHGLVYWPHNKERFPTEEAYLKEFEKYPYIIVRSNEISGSTMHIGSASKRLTAQEFFKKYDSKKLRLHNMIKDFR